MTTTSKRDECPATVIPSQTQHLYDEVRELRNRVVELESLVRAKRLCWRASRHLTQACASDATA